MSTIRTVMLASLSAAIIAACSHASLSPSPGTTNEIFVDASDRLGELVIVEGFLRYTVENRNLYPRSIATKGFSHEYCLPMLVPTSNSDLIRIMKAADGTMVRIEGMVTMAAPAGKVSVTACKQVGIEVASMKQLPK
jgi:hypothetical protein